MTIQVFFNTIRPCLTQAIPPKLHYNNSMENTYARIRQELDLLHFENARDLLATIPAFDHPYEYSMYSARMHRGLYQFDKALQSARAAANAAQNYEDKALANVEEAKILLSTGKYSEAESILEGLLSNWKKPAPASASFALACLFAQTGRVQEAIEELESLLPKVEERSDIDGKLLVDLCVLFGDLLTFTEHPAQSAAWYLKALLWSEFSIPEAWKELRKALVWNNLADLFEQEEQFDQAEICYEEALHSLEEQEMRMEGGEIEPVTDFPGYKLEIYLSLANFYANIEQYDKAEHWIHKIEYILEDNPPIQKSYFQGRLAYLKGLVNLYKDTPKSRKEAAQDLMYAYKLQKELLAKGLEKPEHVGKCAYYLAAALPQIPPFEFKRRQLYEEALKIFESVAAKEPKFYLSGIAEIENELGSCCFRQDDAKASWYYYRAMEDYEKYIQRYPNDTLALESLLYTMLNLSRACARENDLEQSASLVEKILEKMKELAQKEPDLEESIYFLLEEIKKDEEIQTPAMKSQIHDLESSLQSALFKA